MTDPSADWADDEILEYARAVVTERLDQAQRALDRGCSSIEEVLEDQGLPSEIVQVFEPDVRFIGHVDYRTRRGLLLRQFVYRDQRQREKFYVLSVGTRTILRQRGHALLAALVHDERESN